MWYKINSLKLLDQVNDLVADHLERETAANADYLVSPSHYMVNWLLENNWKFPSREKILVQQHVAPKWLKKHRVQGAGGSEIMARGDPVKITELV